MRAIPPKLRLEMERDPFYLKCCADNEDCKGRIEWHHNLIYAGRQVNEKWCILPLCVYHHSIEKESEFGSYLDWVMVNRATEDELKKYSKAANYLWVRAQLNKIYK